MPELPEVETIRGQLEPIVSGRRIVSAWAHESPKFAPATLAIGRTITGVRRRGKYLLFPLDDDCELIAHLGMTGGFAPRSTPSADPYVRARWHFDDGVVLEFRDIRRFGRIAYVPAGDHRSLATLHRLGPEPLGDDFTAELLRSALGRSTARIKTQLLQQRVVAGVGNIYADEALWRARVHPAARAISRPKAVALHAALRDVLAAGLVNGGTTLRDYRDVRGGSGSNQHHLSCYGRFGEPCLRCGTTLRRTVLDGRGTTWCPTCQRR